MSVSAVYEVPEGSPKYAVRVRSTDHVAVHRFYTEADAEDFRERAVAPPDNLDRAVALARQVLEGEAPDECPTAVHALAHLTHVVEARMRELGRK